MNKNTLEIFNQLSNGKQIILGKARQTGASWASASLEAWRILHKSYERAQRRKKIINDLFNI